MCVHYNEACFPASKTAVFIFVLLKTAKINSLLDPEANSLTLRCRQATLPEAVGDEDRIKKKFDLCLWQSCTGCFLALMAGYKGDGRLHAQGQVLMPVPWLCSEGRPGTHPQVWPRWEQDPRNENRKEEKKERSASFPCACPRGHLLQGG